MATLCHGNNELKNIREIISRQISNQLARGQKTIVSHFNYHGVLFSTGCHNHVNN